MKIIMVLTLSGLQDSIHSSLTAKKHKMLTWLTYQKTAKNTVIVCNHSQQTMLTIILLINTTHLLEEHGLWNPSI